MFSLSVHSSTEPGYCWYKAGEMNGSSTNHPPRSTPYIWSCTQSHVELSGGVHELSCALLLNGFFGSDTPAAAQGPVSTWCPRKRRGTRNSAHVAKSHKNRRLPRGTGNYEHRRGRLTEPSELIVIRELLPIFCRDGRPVAT